MDCCENNIDKEKKMKVKGGNNKMKIRKSTFLWVVIGVLFVVALFMIFKAGDASAVQTAGQAARSIAAPVQQASSGMVGGC